MMTETEHEIAATAATAHAERREVGEVEHAADGALVVSTGGGLTRARLALSCLVQPACGDRVLLERCAGEAYVLAVLERRSPAPLVIELRRPLTLAVDGELALAAHAVRVRGEAVEIAGGRVRLVATTLSWLAETLETAARLVTQVAERWSTRARSHDRHVEELELARVGHLDLRAEHLINVTATHTILSSRELAKIDGRQIQVG
jgi:hypothetical protein